jgi:hypothetical protein
VDVVVDYHGATGSPVETCVDNSSIASFFAHVINFIERNEVIVAGGQNRGKLKSCLLCWSRRNRHCDRLP